MLVRLGKVITELYIPSLVCDYNSHGEHVRYFYQSVRGRFACSTEMTYKICTDSCLLPAATERYSCYHQRSGNLSARKRCSRGSVHFWTIDLEDRRSIEATSAIRRIVQDKVMKGLRNSAQYTHGGS